MNRIHIAMPLSAMLFVVGAARAQSPDPETSAPEKDGRVQSAKVHRFERRVMSTDFRLQIFSADLEGAEAAANAAFDEVERIHEALSAQRPESELARLNGAAGGEPVAVSDELLDLLSKAQSVSKNAAGAFALTATPVEGLWNFRVPAGQGPMLPTLESVEARLRQVDDSKLVVGEATAQLAHEGMAIDLPDLVRGQEIERALEIVSGLGFENAMVLAGGDIATRGAKGGRPWIVGLQEPRADGYFAVLPTEGEAIATRGDYERFFELEGVRYHSVIDPRSGFPAAGTRSVSVIARNATLAAAYAKAIFVLGPEKGLTLAESRDEIETVIVNGANQVLVSTGLAERLRILHQPVD